MGIRQKHLTRVQDVEQHYSARNRARIRAYLATYPELNRVLIEAVDHIYYLFGQDLTLTLEVVANPEVPEEEQLFAYIKVPVEEVDEAFETLEQFDDQWFLDQQTYVNGHLNFSLDFV